MSYQQRSIQELIKQSIHHDKDERYMAINDICTYLARTPTIDSAIEKAICDAILVRLDDETNDVQSVAVRCLGQLVKRVRDLQIQAICQKLSSLLRQPKKDMRDIYSIGLKQLVNEVDESMAKIITQELIANQTNGIIGCISQNESVETKREGLDILTPILNRFGTKFQDHHSHILTIVISQLEHKDISIRKRAAACLGSLSTVIRDELLNTLIEDILGRIQKIGNNFTSPSALTLVQAISSISNVVGFRLGKHVDKLIPVLIRFCGNPDDEDQQTEVFDTIRIECLPGLERFVKHCHGDVTREHVGAIVELAVKLMKYDPNYQVQDEEEDEDAMETAGGGGAGGDSESEEYESDDHDNSWKVRKVATIVLAAVYRCRIEDMENLMEISSKELCSRLKDREENVRVEVVVCIQEMINSCQKFIKRHPSNTTIMPFVNVRLNGIIKVCKSTFSKQKAKYEKTKRKLFELLGVLVKFLGDGISRELRVLISFSENIISKPTQATRLKEEALYFVRTMLENLSASVLAPNLNIIFTLIDNASNDTWHKTVLEVMKCLSCFVNTLTGLPWVAELSRPLSPSEAASDSANVKNLRALVQTSFKKIVLPRLDPKQTPDMDVNEFAIKSASQLLSSFGDLLSPELPTTLQIFHTRLQVEFTRVHTLKALIAIIKSPLNLSIKELYPDGIKLITSFMKQQNRLSKQYSMDFIEELIKRKSETFSPELVNIIIVESTNQMSDNDLLLAQTSIRIATTLLKMYPTQATAQIIKKEVYEKVLDMAKSHLVNGATVDCITELLVTVCTIPGTPLDDREVMQKILSYFVKPAASAASKDSAPMSRQSIVNLASCAATIAKSSKDCSGVVKLLAAKLNDAKASTVDKQFSLCALGEIGCVVDFSQDKDTASVTETMLGCFDSAIEEIKLSSATSFGKMCCGNMDVYMEKIMQIISTQQNVYLILTSLKEAISIHVAQKKSLQMYIGSLRGVFNTLINNDDESIRNVVSECMGLLLILHDQEILPWLVDLITNPGRNEKWTALTALRHALSNRDMNSQVVFGQLQLFFGALADTDVIVRKGALLLLNTAYFYHTVLGSDSKYINLYDFIAPHLLVNLDFVKKITLDLGAVKHTEDQGLPLRKASLTCLETILGCFGETLAIEQYILGRTESAADGSSKRVGGIVSKLLDTSGQDKEIKTQACQVIIKMCNTHPSMMSSLSGQLINPLTAMLSEAAAEQQKLGQARGTPEFDRCSEVFRVCIRTIDAISKIDVVAHNPLWTEFSEGVKKNPKYNVE